MHPMAACGGNRASLASASSTGDDVVAKLLHTRSAALPGVQAIGSEQVTNYSPSWSVAPSPAVGRQLRRSHTCGCVRIFRRDGKRSRLQPSAATREVQLSLWKELILDYCRSQRIYIISLEQDFPLFSNPAIERSLSREAKEVFLSALVSEGRAEWMDRNCTRCLILWLTIQDWASYTFNFVKENGLGSTMPVEDIRSGSDTRGTELEGIDSTILMRALRLLEQKGKAAIFKVNDSEGVKFCV